MSDISANLHFLSTERRNEYLKELNKLNSQNKNRNVIEKNIIKMKKLESSDEIPEVNQDEDNSDSKNSKSSKDEEDNEIFEKCQDSIDDNYMDKVQEESIHLNKCRSELKSKVSLREEILENAYNTHEDDLSRQQESENWSEQKKALYQKLDKLIDKHVEQIIDHIFRERELQEIFQNDEREDSETVWKKRFLDYTLKAIRLVKPSQRMLDDTMDINDYVKIELIEYGDDSKCSYINGCVIKNNIADRKMRSKIDNPKILLIGNSIGFFQDDSFADLETYVKQENHYIEILMDRISQANPDIIVIEKDISRSILCKIRELNITVIINVKRSSLDKIARCTETLVTPSVNLIEQYFELGTCK